ncbi:MAG: hypothetical protein HY303_08600 [Candidatus Wallbacteria bacterium]|nr:hypothetical protein [Candidatus Wallbacteria bacterium]
MKRRKIPDWRILAGAWLALAAAVWGAEPARLEKFATRASLTAMAATTGGLYFVTLQGTPLGASLMRWRPGEKTAAIVEPKLAGTRFRWQDGRLLYLRETPQGSRLVARDPAGGDTRETPLPGVAAQSLRFAFPDGDTLLVTGRAGAGAGDAPAVPLVYTMNMHEASPLPLLPGCPGATVLEVVGPTEAISSCGDRLVRCTFAGPLRSATPLAGGGFWPLAPTLTFEVGEDTYLGSLLALGKDGTGPGFRLLKLGPPNWRLPPDAEIAAVFQRSEDDVLLVQRAAGSGARSDWIARPRQGRQTSTAASGPLTGTPIYWGARDLLLWREGETLVVFDCRHLRPVARARIAGNPAPIPGRAAGARLLLASRHFDSTDLFWISVDGGLSFQCAAAGLRGRPVAFFSAPGTSTCYVVSERQDGPALDLFGF